MSKSRDGRRSKRRPKTNGTSGHEELIDALTALDLLRARLSEIDAFASAADDRVDAVPGRLGDPDQRRRLLQLVELVAATAKATRDAVGYGERLAAAAMRSHLAWYGRQEHEPSPRVNRGAVQKLQAVERKTKRAMQRQHRRRKATP